jgi:hypothetical protein
VGTLLLALGVGVEIGKSGDKPAATAAPVRVVTVNGGSGTATTASATATPTATASGGKAAASDKGKQDATKQPDAKAQTVNPVITPSAKATPPPVVKLGDKGHGPGYKNNKFTGDFFGG